MRMAWSFVRRERESVYSVTHEGQEGKVTHAVGVFLHDRLVDANTGIVVDITRLGQTDDGVNEDVLSGVSAIVVNRIQRDAHHSLALTGSADGQLPVRAVHRVARLEGDDLPPGELLEVVAELGRGVAESDVVVVLRRLDRLHLATDVEVFDLRAEVGDGGVRRVVRAEDLLRLLNAIRLVNVLDGDDRKGLLVTRVAEGEARTGRDREVVDVFAGNVEGDGHGEQHAIRQAHGVHNATESVSTAKGIAAVEGGAYLL